MNFKTLFSLNIRFINFGGHLKYIKYAIFNRNLFSVVKQNSALYKKKTCDTCYICALGPSLKEVELSKIQGDTIVVNRFNKIGRENPTFVPTFYLIIDALFNTEENKKDFIDALEQYHPKDTIYLLHSKLSKMVKDLLPPERVYFLSCFKGLFSSEKEFAIDKVMPAFGNVACTAIACALALGYKKIVLLGCDFNSFASTTRSHCYNEKTSERLHKMSYELYCYSLVADMHDQLQRYAKKHNVVIINSSKGSLIDAYPYQIDEKLYK